MQPIEKAGTPRTLTALHSLDKPMWRADFQDYLERRNQPVPGWAWINSVAHGDLKMVRNLAQTNDRSRGPQAAVTDLAKQTLRIVDQGDQTLQDLQRPVLIPVEGYLIDARPTAIPVDAVKYVKPSSTLSAVVSFPDRR